jgi:hypothetical protein
LTGGLQFMLNRRQVFLALWLIPHPAFQHEHTIVDRP